MLRFAQARKSYGSITAVERLTLEVRKGEVFGLLGPNGAGKTTTVKLAVGLVSPDSGTVEIEGAGAPDHKEARRKIGMAPQTLALYEELTGAENLAFFGRLHGLSGKRLKERIAWALELSGLQDRGKHRVRTYSGGMQRRINLAIALVHDPPLLLLDEPTVGVDPQSRNAIFDSIERLKGEGRTIVYTTHYMEEAQRLCDRVGIMDQGRLLALGTVKELITAYGGRRVLVAETDEGIKRVETDDPITDLSRMQETGFLHQFHFEVPNLERVFLNLTGRHLRDE